MSAKKIIFITGTDTGVGKTLLTALLLHHLRLCGVHALAMKPFCSGGRADVRLLQSLQLGELSDAEVNPFYFSKPVAPLVEMTPKKLVRLQQVLDRIESVKCKCDTLLIEGSGGLMVPLGEAFTVVNLIGALDCKVLVVARNALGTINHTVLTINALQLLGFNDGNLAAVLMSGGKPDLSSLTNQKVISKMIRPVPILSVPYLSRNANTVRTVRKHCLKLKKTFAKLVGQ